MPRSAGQTSLLGTRGPCSVPALTVLISSHVASGQLIPDCRSVGRVLPRHSSAVCAKGPWSEWGPWEMRGEQMATLLWAVALGRFWEGRGLTTLGGLGPQGTTNKDITLSGAAWHLLRDCLWVHGWGPPPLALGPPATLFHVASQCPSPFPSACRECPVSKHLVGGGLTSRMWWSEGRGREGPCVLGWVGHKLCGL